MKCCNRYTLGVIIGSIYTLISVIGFILMSVFLVKIQNDHDNNRVTARREESTVVGISMGACVIMGFASGLLIWGIVKKRHNCLLPWLIIYVIAFIFSCMIILYIYLIEILSKAHIIEFIGLTFISIIVIVLQLAIFGLVCKLYKSIRKNNIEESQAVAENLQDEYLTQPCYYSVVPNKS